MSPKRTMDKRQKLSENHAAAPLEPIPLFDLVACLKYEDVEETGAGAYESTLLLTEFDNTTLDPPPIVRQNATNLGIVSDNPEHAH